MAEAHPVGFRWVMKAKERGARVIHVDPTLLAHQPARRPARADPGGHRHRVPRRPDPPRDRDRLVLQGVRGQLHQRLDDHRRALQRHRGPRRACSPASIPQTGTYDTTTWVYEGGQVAAAGRRSRALDRRRSAIGHRRRDAGRRRQARRDAPGPALRVPDPPPPLQPLHAGDGPADLRDLERAIPRGRRRADHELRARAHRRVLSTRSGGRSTPRACR